MTPSPKNHPKGWFFSLLAQTSTGCACTVTTDAGDRTRLTAEAPLRLHRLAVAVTRATDDVTRVERHRDAHARHAARVVTQL